MGKTVVIGAGLAGLSAAYHARLSGLDCEVFERSDRAGGLCATIEREGFLFDYSGHLLHLKIPYFQGLVKELLGDNITVIGRKAFIYSNGVYTRYPFQANLYGLPPDVAKECLLGFVKACYENEDHPSRTYGTFRDWILGKLGEGIGKHFMFPYNEKLWTVPTEELTCGWLSEYVPRPTLQEVFDGAFLDQTKGFGYNATFWYPKRGGIQALSDALAGKAGTIRFGEEVERVFPDRRAVHLASGKTAEYELLISTMPLDKLVGMLEGNVPAAVKEGGRLLTHNSLLIVNLGVRGEGLTDKHWIYLPEKKLTPYRVGTYSNFSAEMAPPGTTSYYVEIAYRKEWNVDKEGLADKAVSDVVEIGLVPRRQDIVVRDVRDVACAYVIYDRHYERCRTAIMDYLRSKGIASIGRYGGWEYSGMEEAMDWGKVSGSNVFWSKPK